MHNTMRQTTTALRLTHRGKLLVSALLFAMLALLITLTWSRPAVPPAVAVGSQEAETYREIVVQPGDTLWSISSRVSQVAEPAVVLEQIVTYNALTTSDLQVGQTLYVPVYHE